MNASDLLTLRYFLLALGGIMILVGLVAALLVQRTRNWIKIRGEILGSWIEEERDSDNDKQYYGRVEYTYAVDGKLYGSRRIKMIENQHGTRHEAQRIVRQYPKQKPVDVYYNPANPDQAVLELVSSDTGWGIVIIGILLLGAGVILLILG